MPLIPGMLPLTLPEVPTVSAIHPANTTAMGYQRSGRLVSAPHRESYGCSFCGQAWFVRFGRNALPTSSTDCPRCGEAGEP